MLKISYPEIDVKNIEKEILHELSCTYQQNNSIETVNKINLTQLKQQNKYIESFIKTAKSRAEVRQSWPQSLNRFPVILLKPLGFILLIILKVLFKDQREVNFNILGSLKEFLKLNEKLLNQIDLINSDIQKNFQNINFFLTGERRSPQAPSFYGGVTVTDITKKLDKAHHLEQQFEEKAQHLEQQISYLQSELNQQKRLVATLIEEAKKTLSKPGEQKQLETFVEEESHLLDAFYVAFEDRFRGTREEIRARQKIYLPFLAESKIDRQNSLILDIGCGRGEWLELLQDAGYKAKGIDINRVMVEQCCSRGLDATEVDAISYLKSLPNTSIGAITGFHIIEHLPFEVLLQLFDEALRVVHSGGLLIFETPNPENVLVGSCTFYLDPTHRNPLPSQMIKFVAESRGWQSVKIVNLNPVLQNQQLKESDLPEPLNQYFYGARDYAIVGYKA